MTSRRKFPLTYEEFEVIYSKVPRLTVDAYIVVDGGVVLLERADQSWQGMWHVPGGAVFYREAVADALDRIVRDEVGVELVEHRLIGYTECFSEEAERGFGYSVSLDFECQVEGELPDVNADGEDIRVFSSVPEKTVEEQKMVLRNLLEDV